MLLLCFLVLLFCLVPLFWGRHVVLPFSFPCYCLPGGWVVALPLIKSCSSKKRIYDSGSFWVEEDRSADVYKLADIPE